MVKPKGSLWLVFLVMGQAVLAFNCGQTYTITPFNHPNSISISISPATAALAVGQTLQLTASVTGTDKKDVDWTILSSSAEAGAIDANGLYKAPAKALMTPIRIRAGSITNPLKNAFATIWVLAPGTVSNTNHPLVAQYSIMVPDGGKAKIEFGPDTSYGLNTWAQPAPTGGGPVNILVAGMRMSTTYHMRADVDLPDGTPFQDVDHAFQTQSPPTNLIPQITATHQSGMALSGGVEMMDLLPSSDNSKLTAVVTDLDGNLIWYYDFPEQWTSKAFPFPLREPLPNGNILLNLTPSGGGTGAPGNLREIDLTGNTIREMTTADFNARLADSGFSLQVNAISHEILPLSNGHLILLVNYLRNYNGTNIYDDALVDVDMNWNPVWVWDTFDHLDINRQPEGWPDWTHGNAVEYTPDDGNLIFSMRHQNWIIKIDYEDGKGSGDVLWRLGYQGDFKLEGGTSPQDWFFAQHGPHIISPSSAGIFDMVVFDNGNWRRLDDSENECGTTGQPACNSRVPVYHIDEATKTATLTWVSDLTPAFSTFGGNAEGLPNGSLEFDICDNGAAKARAMEVTPDPTPQAVWQLDVTGQYAYRAFRIPSLYPGVQW